MSKLWLVLGTFFEIFAIAFLLMGVLNAEDSPVTQIIGIVACKPPEKMVTETENWSQPNGEFGQSITYYCEIEPGVQREVTGTAFGILAAGFAIPLILGIILITVGARGLVRQQSRKYSAAIDDYFTQYPPVQTTTSSHVVDLRSGQANIPPEAQEILTNVLGGFATAFTSDGKGTLAERLQQLEDAYEQDLIRKDEYDKVRQAILDSMDD